MARQSDCSTLLPLAILAGTLLLASCRPTGTPTPPPESDLDLTTAALAIHRRVLTLDTHVDIPFEFATPLFDPLDGDMQVTLRTMRDGGLDAAFFIVYVGQTERTADNYAAAHRDAMTKFDAIRRMTHELYPERIGLAYRADDVEALIAEGRLAAMIGVENGYVLGADLEWLDDYYRLGARYVTLVHNGHNDLADSASPRPALGDSAAEHEGISELGMEAIERMNRLGIMVDVSHASKDASIAAMQHSRAPVIASHSSVRALTDHQRNMDDETLLALRDNGGVIQVTAFESFLVDEPPARVSDFVDHIDHAVDLIGIEHVGISSDFGGGGGIVGWMDAGETANVTRELVRRGYSEQQIALLWSGNLLRVWRQVEAIAAAD